MYNLTVFPKTIKSISGKSIRLTEERWEHIKQRHPEITTHLDKVLETVKNPELITCGWIDELIAIKKFGDQDLAVIYKEQREGFIVTAFFTRSRKYFEKRGIAWNKH